MPAPEHLSPRQFGYEVDVEAKAAQGKYEQRGRIASVDPRSLIATQDWLHSKPSMAKAAKSAHRPNVREGTDGKNYIVNGHHRVIAHAKANKNVLVNLFRPTD